MVPILRGNKTGNDLNTVIVPVEVIAGTGGGDGGSGGGEDRPDPVVSQSNLVLD